MIAPITLLVTGAPRTKKTHPDVFRTGRECRCCHNKTGPLVVAPSKYWRHWVRKTTVWRKIARGDDVFEWVEIESWIDDKKHYHLLYDHDRVPDVNYNSAALIYREKRLGDTAGYIQGLADLLESRDIITNDRQFVTWDGTKPLLDPSNPRVEVTLTPLTDLQESLL